MTTILERGTRLYNKMVSAWLEAAWVSFEIGGDKEARGEFRAAFGRDPKKIVRAATLFPDTFRVENAPDLFDILAAIHIASKVKDDVKAAELFTWYQDEKSYDDLRERVKDIFANNRKSIAPKRDEAELATKRQSLIDCARRIDDLLWDFLAETEQTEHFDAIIELGEALSALDATEKAKR